MVMSPNGSRAYNLDEKPLALRYLGNTVPQKESRHFVEEAKALGEQYWDNRWYKYTSKCQGEGNISLLEKKYERKRN